MYMSTVIVVDHKRVTDPLVLESNEPYLQSTSLFLAQEMYQLQHLPSLKPISLDCISVHDSIQDDF